MVTKDEILEYFQPLDVKLDEKVLEKCLELCVTYNIEAEDFVDLWAAYTLTNQNGAPPTLEGLQKMERKELQNLKDKLPITNSEDISCGDDWNAPECECANTTEPAIIKKTPLHKPEIFNAQNDTMLTASPASKAVQYSKRTQSRTVQCFYGSTSAQFKRESSYTITIKNVYEATLQHNTRYMYEVVGKKANAINNLVNYVGHCIREKYKLTLHDGYLFTNNGDEIVTYGRIISDSEGKINNESILLEGTCETNAGRTTRLNINNLSKYALFPGQVVAVRGNLCFGNTLVAEEIYSDTEIDTPLEPPIVTDPMQIVVACGPFTTQDNVCFEPLDDLLKYVLEYRPHILLLLGPFFEETNEIVCNNGLIESYEDLFERTITSIMNKLACTDIQILVVASQKELYHHPVYPTPPYTIRETFKNLTFLPDPCVVNVNGLVIAATTADILFHFTNNEISVGGTDRMTRLVSHLFAQHCFYPLDPPNEEINMDYSLFEQYGLLDVRPHVLVLPSKLRHFIKNAQGCLAVNPERLIKGYGGGSFARIEITPGNTTSVCDRVSCQVLKI